MMQADVPPRAVPEHTPRVTGEAPSLWLKYAFDKAFAVFALILLAPIMLIVAALIWRRRDGPIFFAHTRIGEGGVPFRCLKFRTMIHDGSKRFAEVMEIDPIARDEWTVNRKIYRDPRVDRLGAVLRATSLDELPQFLNVLRGEMSIVGPRPVTAEEVEMYGIYAGDYLSVRPGVTGSWQVSGRNDLDYEERVLLDSRYVRSRTFLGDMAIILKTVKVVITRQGAS